MEGQIDLTEDQSLYLQRIFDCFQEQSQWPTYGELDQWFTHYHPDLDIEILWKSLPQGLTSYMDLNQLESRAALTVPGIYALKNNAHVLSSFLEVMKLCVSTYLHSRTGKMEVRSEWILRDNPHWWHIGVHQAGQLLREEPNIWSSFGGPDPSGQWQCTLRREIRRFRDILTIEDYLEKRNLPRPQAPAAFPPGDVIASAVRVSPAMSVPPQQVLLHPDVLAKCWGFYTQGDYDSAILSATKVIEVAVRKKSRLADDVVGAALITQAFKTDNPVLQYSHVKAEQEGIMALLRGIILVYKNPQSHRFVGMQNASECLGILLMCSSLLYTIDAL